MIERHSRTRPTTATPTSRGPVAGLFGAVVGVAGALIATLIGSIALEWTGMVIGWWSGVHAADLLAAERDYIEAIEDYPLSALEPLEAAAIVGQSVDSAARWLGLVGHAGMYVMAAINAAKLVALRLVIGVFTIPAFCVVALVALLDGLTAREIRKYTGGHESAYVFHKAKRFILPSLALTISLYLMLPISVPPVVVFGPTLLLTGAAIYTATSRFKKYL